MKAWLPIFTVSAVAWGCVSRAPTDCELDKRSGLYTSSFCDKDEVASAGERPALVREVVATSEIKHASIPIREQPVIARIWVRDQLLDGGHWMQGTWLFVEVAPSRWSGESASGRTVAVRKLGSRRTALRTRAFNPAGAQSFTVEPGAQAKGASRGGRE